MQLTLTAEDRAQIAMELAKELAAHETEAVQKLSPEDISEFRFVHTFDSIDDLLSLYEKTAREEDRDRTSSFYCDLALLMSDMRTYCDFKDRIDHVKSEMQNFCRAMKFPCHLGIVLIPEHALHQDVIFYESLDHLIKQHLTKQIYTFNDAAKSTNWRGNILTVHITPKTEPKIFVPDIHPHDTRYRGRACVATFEQDDKGQYAVKKCFLG